MRPASHIPLAEMIIFGTLSKFIARDSSLVVARVSPSKEMGLMPLFTNCIASSSKQESLFSLKMRVASIARGEST